MSTPKNAGKPAKGKYLCSRCGKQFVADVQPDVQCRTCRVSATPVCRRCGHARPWQSTLKQLCKPCVDFAILHESGGLTSTPTGRLSDRPSRVTHWTGKSSAARPRKKSGTSDAENHPWVAAYAHDMRSTPTPAEARLEALLRQLLPEPGQFERQWTFGAGSKRYILDFFIPLVRLGIEVDGGHHRGGRQRTLDQSKEKVALANNVTIRRISNARCLAESDEALTVWLRTMWIEASKIQHARRRQG